MWLMIIGIVLLILSIVVLILVVNYGEDDSPAFYLVGLLIGIGGVLTFGIKPIEKNHYEKLQKEYNEIMTLSNNLEDITLDTYILYYKDKIDDYNSSAEEVNEDRDSTLFWYYTFVNEDLPMIDTKTILETITNNVK